MGGSSSKEEGSYGNSSFSRTDSSAPPWNSAYEPPVPQQPTQGYEHGSYESPYNYPPPQQQYPQASAPAQRYTGSAVADNNRKLDRRYSRIADSYSSLEQVTEALARAGLESSNLIIGIDFTKSNEWTGAKSYNRKSLHHIGDGPNPYQQAIAIIGRTLAAFDEDNLIPCYGFGDASTHDQDVFSFYHEDRFCNGFEEVLNRYKEIVPQLRLAGPTSFAPIIEMAMTIVQQSSGQYHVLVIVADGQVTRSVDTERGHLSPQERKTVEAIVEASKFPLSIILVGVGDGPWDMMKEFDDNIPARAFDNFQFVNFTEIMMKNTSQSRKETEFALAALMEIPSQYKATIELGLLGSSKGNTSQRIPLSPPVHGVASFTSAPSFTKPSYSTSFQPSTSFDYVNTTPASTAPSAPSSNFDDKLCPICLTNPKDMAFGCGHLTCCECGQNMQLCPMCRSTIHTRIKLY